MKTGEAAKLFGVDPSTVRKWIDMDEFNTYFSDSARGKEGPHRFLNDADVLVLNTIRHLRTENRDWDEIIAVLESGSRIQEFPQNAISSDPRTIPLPQAEQSAKAAATLAERDAALERVEELEKAIQKLQDIHAQQLAEARQETDKVRRETQERIDELQTQVAKLNREIGESYVKGFREGLDAGNKD